MFRVIKILVMIVVLMAALAGGVFVVIKHFFSGMDALSMCQESIEVELGSPNKRNFATVFVRNCGATTDYVTHVNLRHASNLTKPNSNGVIAAGEVWSAKGKQPVSLFWKDDANLVIQLQKKTASTIEQATWDSVNVELHTKD